MTFGGFRNEDIAWVRGSTDPDATTAASTDGQGTSQPPRTVEEQPHSSRTVEGNTTACIELRTLSPLAIRGFCATCHSPLFMKYHNRPERTDLCLGTMVVLSDDRGRARDVRMGITDVVKEHIFWSGDGNAELWVAGDDGVKRTEGLGVEFEESLRLWREDGGRDRGDAWVVPL